MSVTISAFFSGTGFEINDSRFLASSLYNEINQNKEQIKFGFNGCGVDFGLRGTIFGSDIDKHCDTVITEVLSQIQAGNRVTLNVYGHSRGAIEALLLAKQFSDIDLSSLEINLALLDPVPGNLISAAKIDPLKICLANKTMDLTNCKPLRHVLALYPHEPLNDLAFHAPLLASYPKDTIVEEEVVNGCHAEAEQNYNFASKLVKLRVKQFLLEHGTLFSGAYTQPEDMNQAYIDLYEQGLARVNKNYIRAAHSANGREIVTTSGADYFNSQHRELAKGNSNTTIALSIKEKSDLFSPFRRFAKNHPVVSKVIKSSLKWCVIGALAVTVLYFTGGLAAVPFIAPLIVKLGLITIAALTPIMTVTLATLWHGISKPMLSWCANKFYYPKYDRRQIELPHKKIHGTPEKLAKVFPPNTSNLSSFNGDSCYNSQEEGSHSFNWQPRPTPSCDGSFNPESTSP